MSTKHTPTPYTPVFNGSFWELRVPHEGDSEVREYSPAVAFVWNVKVDENNIDAKATAHFIAAACNAHDDLVQALKRHEWSICDQDRGVILVCDTCGCSKDYGHASDCATAAALAKADTTQPSPATTEGGSK